MIVLAKARANVKKYLSMLLVITLIFELLLIFQTRSYALELDSYNNDKMRFIVEEFSVSSDWIQNYLDEGYTLNHIHSALYKSKIKNISFEEALNSLYPAEVNLSKTPSVSSAVYGLTDTVDTVSSTVYGLSTGDRIQDITFVEQEDSSVVRYFNPFTVTEEVYGSRETDNAGDDMNKDSISAKSDSDSVEGLSDSLNTS